MFNPKCLDDDCVEVDTTLKTESKQNYKTERFLQAFQMEVALSSVHRQIFLPARTSGYDDAEITQLCCNIGEQSTELIRLLEKKV